MKVIIFLAAYVTHASCASPNRSSPKISINVRDGNVAGVEGLEPTISWSTTGKTDDFDYELGLDVAVRTTDEISTLPKAIYGKMSRRFGRWGLSTRADINVEDLPADSLDLDFRAVNRDVGVTVKVLATAGKDLCVRKLDVTKGFRVTNGKILVNPRFDVGSLTGDVVLTYDRDDTFVQVRASKAKQKLTVARKVSEGNIIAPSIDTSGGFTVQWRHTCSEDNSVITTLVPNDSVNVKWTDGAWTADFDVPMEGASINGVRVSVRRKMEFQ